MYVVWRGLKPRCCMTTRLPLMLIDAAGLGAAAAAAVGATVGFAAAAGAVVAAAAAGAVVGAAGLGAAGAVGGAAVAAAAWPQAASIGKATAPNPSPSIDRRVNGRLTGSCDIRCSPPPLQTSLLRRSYRSVVGQSINQSIVSGDTCSCVGRDTAIAPRVGRAAEPTRESMTINCSRS